MLQAREASGTPRIPAFFLQVDQVDASKLEGKGGYAVVLATVEESADLWATNGKKGDSYKTMYQVRVEGLGSLLSL